MKKFINKLLGSIFVFLTFCILVYAILIKIDLLSRKFGNTKVLFLGDSQIQKGVNSSAFPFSKNMAVSGEPLFFTFYKIKYILKHKNNVKKIVLGIGIHSFSDFYDEIALGKISNLDNTHEYFSYLPREFKSQLLIEHRSDLLKYISRIINSLIINSTNLKHFSSNFAGGFYNNDSSSFDLIKTKQRVNKAFYKNGKVRNISGLCVNYLDSIIQICKINEIQLDIIRMPVYDEYFKLVPRLFSNNYEMILNQRRIKPYSFGKKLNSIYFLPDGDHLNVLGSSIITNDLYNYYYLKY